MEGRECRCSHSREGQGKEVNSGSREEIGYSFAIIVAVQHS